ncbi:MAG: DUF2628 domain-containing protein [Mesorhizobium sp.]
MASYVVMEPPGRAGSGDAVLVRDGFSWLAFFFSPLWLLWHWLWVEALLTFIMLGLLSAASEMAGFGLAGSLLTLLVSLFIGLEGQGLRLAALRRRGWRDIGVVEAQGLADGEIRYTATLEAEPEPQAPVLMPDAARARPIHIGMALGLSHTPGRV